MENTSHHPTDALQTPSQHSVTPHFNAEMYVPGGIAGSQQVYKNNLL